MLLLVDCDEELGVLAIVWPPLRCPKCKSMRAVLSNRMGVTLCVGCNETKLTEAARCGDCYISQGLGMGLCDKHRKAEAPFLKWEDDQLGPHR